MARTKVRLEQSARLADYLSASVLVRVVPRRVVDEVLAEYGKAGQRERALPAYLVVYYVMALSLYMGVSYEQVLRCLLEGMRWLKGDSAPLRLASKGAVSQARERLGYEVMQALAERCMRPLAQADTPGAFWRGRRVVAMDGSTLEVADESANARAFGYPGANRGAAAFPQLRFVGLLETGTHALFAVALDRYAVGELALAQRVLPKLEPSMLCLADRGYVSYALWQAAASRGAMLLWRVRNNQRLPELARYEDGSFASKLYPDTKAKRHDRQGLAVRVIEYELQAAAEQEPVVYRLMTNVLDASQAPGIELAQLYHERWEIEGAFDEMKTHLKGPRSALRSKTPELVKQEFYGLVLAHYAIRSLMHEAARQIKLDSDRLSFTHAVRVVQRRLPSQGAFPP